ncbi:hypothetical protein NQ315_006991 [Exocentrus adspersus]|uniref:Secreted protein n=1 Tax=Exocentrus adspersus TaxID=1586481 RepID=A0AAV8WDR7_9CUCU|nr:hypothetical protein NQ315_006991 [Exocentrus adspersus]
MCRTIIVVVITGVFLKQVVSHGMFLNPPNRSSLWRYNRSARINYDDNGINCGGFHLPPNKEFILYFPKVFL